MSFILSSIIRQNVPAPKSGEAVISEDYSSTRIHLNYGEGLYCIRFLKKENVCGSKTDCDFSCLSGKRTILGGTRDKEALKSIIEKMESLEEPFHATILERCRDVKVDINSINFRLEIKNFKELNEKCKFKSNYPFKCASRTQKSDICIRDNVDNLYTFSKTEERGIRTILGEFWKGADAS